MIPPQDKSSHRTPADADGRQKRIRQLESELHKVQEQLRTMSLANASQLLVISQVYNLASVSEGSPATMSNIKHIIESNQIGMRSKLSTSPTYSSGSSGGAVTPPSTEPGSRLSATASSGNASTDERGDDNLKTSKDNAAKPLRPMAAAEHHDLLRLAENSPTKPNDSDATLEARSIGQVTSKNMPTVKPVGAIAGKVSGSKNGTKVGAEGIAKAKPSPKMEVEDVDAMWQEFSLEEELEGIADAPAKNREAMRAALREKEEETRKRLRETAEEKRRIAEKEGLLLKKAASRPAVQKRVPSIFPLAEEKPKQYTKNNSNKNTPSFSRKQNKFSVQPVAQTTRKATTQTAVEVPGWSVPEQKPTPETVAPSIPPVPKPAASDSDSDPDGEKPSKSSNCRQSRTYTWTLGSNTLTTDVSTAPGIISLEPESPKNADRFGITFDPSKLDAATAAEVCGTCDWKDSRRSILIQNIPHEYSMHKLLAHVRGGRVVVAHLVPDIMGSGHSLAAMVTFKTAEEATASVKITAALLARSEAYESVMFGSATKISVTLLPTPTYPSRGTLSSAVPAGFSLAPVEEKTRCIYVSDFPMQHTRDLCTELMFGVGVFPSKTHALEEMWFNGNTLHMQFTSIQEAERAHGIISIFHFRKYNGLVHYAPDPCAAKISSMDSLFVGGSIKLSSAPFQPIKHVVESVSLVTFSRNHEPPKPAVQATKPASTGVTKMSFSSLLSRTRTIAPQPGIRVVHRQSTHQPVPVMQTGITRAETSNPLIDVSFDASTEPGVWSSVPTSAHDESAGPLANVPWTADQMVGLDMF